LGFSAAAKAWTGGTVVYIAVAALVAAVQAALGARLFDGLPIGIGAMVTAFAPAILGFAATWLAKNKPA